jgi:hypothetical protein
MKKKLNTENNGGLEDIDITPDDSQYEKSYG